MGRPRRDEHKVATPERILRAAVVEFAEVGYEAARLEDIATRAGIQRPAVLYHFPSKLELYSAVCERVFTDLAALMMGRLAQEGSVEDRIVGVAKDVAAQFEREPMLAKLFVREVVSQSPITRKAARTIADPIVTQLEQGIIAAAGDRLRPGLPVRGALLAIWSNILLCYSSGPLRKLIWKTDETEALVRLLFLSSDAPASK
jgi:AcrR family transcriptional regulator